MIIYIPGPIAAIFHYIFYYIQTILLSPGVVIHEVAHRLACDLLKVPVYKMKYFTLKGEVAGYVLHGNTSLKNHVLISTAPLFFNTFLCMLFTFPLASQIYIGYNEHAFESIFTGWLGFAIGYHAFPSNHDMQILYEIAHKENSRSTKNLHRIYLLFKILNALREFYISVVYVIGVSLFIPYILFS